MAAEHADYPHWPGALYDCAACEAHCYCEGGVSVRDSEDARQCVRCAILAETACEFCGWRAGEADGCEECSPCEACALRTGDHYGPFCEYPDPSQIVNELAEVGPFVWYHVGTGGGCDALIAFSGSHVLMLTDARDAYSPDNTSTAVVVGLYPRVDRHETPDPAGDAYGADAIDYRETDLRSADERAPRIVEACRELLADHGGTRPTVEDRAFRPDYI